MDTRHQVSFLTLSPKVTPAPEGLYDVKREMSLNPAYPDKLMCFSELAT
jgi:hypothetical protein